MAVGRGMTVKRKLVATTSVAYMPVQIWHVKGLVEKNSAAGQFHRVGEVAIIELDTDLPQADKLDTLIHELIHACDSIWTFKLPEHTVRALATTLCQALRGMKKVTARSAGPKGKPRSR